MNSSLPAVRPGSSVPGRRVMAAAFRLLLGLSMLLGHAPGALAAAGEGRELGPKVQAQLQKAQRAAERNEFERAMAILDVLERGEDLNSYEQANIHYFRGYIHEAQSQRAEAIAEYERMLRQPQLPVAMETGTRFRLAELYMQREDYANAVQAINAWFTLSTDPNPEAYVLLARAHYGLGQLDQALQQLGRGIDESRRRGQPVQEAWYLLARALYFEKGDRERTVQALEQLVNRWPRKAYFLQLSGLYGELGDKRRQLAAMELSHFAGWLNTGEEILNLAYLYLDNGLPRKAAELLDAAIVSGVLEETARDLETLGIAWRRAHETQRALKVLEHAAVLADDAETWARLAGIELAEERHVQAVRAARNSLALGGGRRPDSTRVVLGVGLYNLGSLEDARAAFSEAGKDTRSAVVAEQWIKLLDRELRNARSDADA